jgi:hypothetical protein
VVDFNGWSYADSSRLSGDFDLSDFGVVAVGESVILTEGAIDVFRTAWPLLAIFLPFAGAFMRLPSGTASIARRGSLWIALKLAGGGAYKFAIWIKLLSSAAAAFFILEVAAFQNMGNILWLIRQGRPYSPQFDARLARGSEIGNMPNREDSLQLASEYSSNHKIWHQPKYLITRNIALESAIELNFGDIRNIYGLDMLPSCIFTIMLPFMAFDS